MVAHEVELVGGPVDGEWITVPECYLGLMIRVAAAPSVQSLNSIVYPVEPLDITEMVWEVAQQLDETHWRARWVRLSAPPAER